jgi:sugar lactone lactonase YvrE
MIFDNRPCDLGEGPLWHPMRQQLFWFDITGQRMLSVEKGEQRQWLFPEMVSAAGWVDRDMLLIAGERDLFFFDVETEEIETLVELESDNRRTRSNDGRADPQGGFWIGTMGKTCEVGAGAIYRYFGGELRKLYSGITISNAICFTPDGKTAHFTDTVTSRVMRVALDGQGWPKGEPEVFLDLTADPSGPDGAVIDAGGLLWLARWGAGQVSAFAPDGSLIRHVSFDAPHTSCPAFGGADLTTLFCTSALEGMDPAARAAHPDAGKTFAAHSVAKGQAEYRIIP